MMDWAPPELLPALYWAGAALLVVWNLVAAGQAARVRRAAPWLASLTSAAGFLILPALLVALLTTSSLDGRTLHVVSWLWPVTCLLTAAQCLSALATGQAPRWISLPAAVYGVLVASIAIARWLTGLGFDPGLTGTSLLAAQQSVLSTLLGRESIETGHALLLPVVAPLFPARWILGQAARPILAVGTAACATLLLVVALPRAVRAVSGFNSFALLAPAQRTGAELVTGLRIFGRLSGAPPALSIRNDMALADSLSAGLVMVTLRPAGTTIRALDSLERVLAPYRRDTVPLQLGVSLAFDRADTRLVQSAPDSLLAARVEMLARVVRVLLPDVVFPMDRPPDGYTGSPGTPPDDWMRRYYAAAADEVHRLRPRTRVGISIGRFVARDSSLYSWGVSTASPVELVALELFPTIDGVAGFEARLATADRWIHAGTGSTPHWVVAGGYPYVFGERSQELSLRRAKAWASRVDAVRAFVIADAADYERLTGLRAAGGRIRFDLQALRDRESAPPGLMTVP